MFEGYLSNLLAATLGHFINVDKEKLRVSLFSAWRTGLSLNNVELRTEAFEYLQLPFRLVHGRVGSVQAQVPWRALRAPVVLELSDVYLQICLRDEDDLHEDAAGERAWAAKQAELAAAELQALATGGGPTGAAPPTAVPVGGKGVLWSFLQHLFTMLVNRLQLTVRNVHIAFQDPQTGTRFGLKLQTLHTCLPSEAEHASVLLSEDAGVLAHSSAAARGSIQKQLAVKGLAVYWHPGSSALQARQPSPQKTQLQRQEEGEIWQLGGTEGGAGGDPAGSEEEGEEDGLPHVLLPTDCVVHLTSQMSAGTMRVHAAAVVHSLQLGLHREQVSDVFRFLDSLQWLSVRNRYAAYRPTAWRQGGSGSRQVPWCRVWQYAINAVMAERRGLLRSGVRWQCADSLEATRQAYAALYVKKLKAARQPAGRSPWEEDAEEQARLEHLERQLPVADLLQLRLLAREQLENAAKAAPAAAAHVVQPAGPLPSHGLGAASTAGLASSSPGSPGSSPSEQPSSQASSRNASGQGQQGYVTWGLSKAASWLGYVPRAEGAAGELPAPSEADMQELYSAVDFHPDQQQEPQHEAAAAARKPAASAAATQQQQQQQRQGMQLSVDCLISQTALMLRDSYLQAWAAAAEGAPEGGWDSQMPTQHASGSGSAELPPSRDVAVLELGRLRLSLQVLPTKVSAGVTLADATIHDLASSGPGVMEHLLGRVPSSSRSPPPLLRLQYTDDRPAGTAAHATAAPTLDVLVQAVELRFQPRCVQALLAFVPPVIEGSFASSVLAAVNALSPAARAALKAEHVHKLGPALDLVVKLLDFQVLLGEPDSATTPSIHLHTGPVVLHTVKEKQFMTAHAAHALLTAIQHRQLPASTAAEAVEAAITAVEQHLVYQKLDFTVSQLQVVATHAALANGSSSNGRSSPKRQPVLQPLQIQGRLKLHRIAEDYGAPQVQASVQLTAVNLSLKPAVLLQLSTSLSPFQGQSGAAHQPAAPAPSAGPSSSMSEASPVSHPAYPGTLQPAGAGSAASAPSAKQSSISNPTLVVVDLRAASIDVGYYVESSSQAADVVAAAPGDRMANGSAQPPAHADAHAHLSIASLSAKVELLLSGLQAHASASGLLMRDLSADQEEMPGVQGVLPRLAKSISIDSADVSVASGGGSSAAGSGSRGGGRGSSSTGGTLTRVELTGVSAQGYIGERGNFICRLHDRRPNQCTIVIDDSPSVMHASYSFSNVQLGHSTLLRITTLFAGPGAGAAGEDIQAEGRSVSPDLMADAGPQEGVAVEGPYANGMLSAEQSHGEYHSPVDAPSADSSPASKGMRPGPEASPSLSSPALRPQHAAAEAPTAISRERTPPLAHQQQPAPQASDAQASSSQAGDPDQGKPSVTDIQLQDCRLHWKYQPAVAPLHGSLAAVHDALSLHEDLLCLDVPHFTLRLPLEPGQAEVAKGREAPPSPFASTAAAAGGGRDAGITMGSRPSDSRPKAEAEQGTPAGRPLASKSSTLISAADIKLSAAVVGLAAHSMLPLLVVPSLQLNSSYSSDSICSSSNACVPGRPTLRHVLMVSALEVGAHPSHTNMLAAAWQLFQDEWELLTREPADHTNDSSSVITSTSGQPESSGHTRSAGHTYLPRASGTALAGAQGQSDTPAVQASPASQASPSAAAAPSRTAAPWRLEAAVGMLGISLLGSTASSTCLKLEWRSIQCHYCSWSGAGAGGQEARLGWEHITLHLLRPRPALPPDFASTPFAVLPPMTRHPSPPALDTAPPFPPEPLFLQAQGMAAYGMRRNLSAGLGLADAPEALEDDTFIDALPSLRGRLSGSSAASRYYSAPESEFEDAASDWAEGSQSPRHGQSHSAPPLPIKLDTSSYESLLLLKLHGQVEPGEAGRHTRVSLVLRPEQQAEVSVDSVAVRLHAGGWEDAALCLHTYRVLAEQARQGTRDEPAVAAGRAGQAAATAPTQGTAAAAAPSASPGPGGSEQPSEQQRASFARLTVHLHSVLLETLGLAERAPEAAMLPACTLHTRASLELRRSTGSELRMNLAIPALLLVCGSVTPAEAADAVLQLPLRDSLLGMRDLELSLLTALSGGSQAGSAAEVAQQQQQQQQRGRRALRLTSMGIGINQLSVWANPCNLSAGAVLGSMVAAETSRLAAHAAGDAHEAERTVAQARMPGASTQQLTVKLNVHQLGLLLSSAPDSYNHFSSPLFELAASRVSADLRDMGSGSLEGTAKARLLLNVLNGQKLAWEPVLEPWLCKLAFAVPLAAGGASARPASRVHISSKQGLELSVSEAVVDTAAQAAVSLQRVSAALAQPGSWGRHSLAACSSAGASSVGHAANFWLDNQTGSGLHIWLVRVADTYAAPLTPPAGPPDLVAPSGRRMPLPLPSSPAAQLHSRHAGQPSLEEGVAHGSTAEQQGPADAEHPHRSLLAQLAQPRYRTLLFFRLQDHGQMCGPLQLDRAAFTMLSIPLLPDLRAKVVCSLEEGRCGSCLLRLHSGVRLHNQTQLAWDVGLQTPMGLVMEPRLLRILAPGETLWLPVLRAESSLLCVRPALPDALAWRSLAVAHPPLAGQQEDAAPGAPRPSSPAPVQRASPSPLVHASGHVSPRRASQDGKPESEAPASQHPFEWSTALPLQQLLHGGRGESGSHEKPRPARLLSCSSTAGDQRCALLCVGAVAPGALGGSGWDILLAAPLTLHNALPMPVDVALSAQRTQHRLHLAPNQRLALHHLDAAHVELLTLRPAGYRPSAPIAPMPIAQAHESELGGQLDSRRSTMSTMFEDSRELHAHDQAVALQELGHGQSGVNAYLRHTLDTATGAHTLRFGCTMWVYNCTGVPISLRQSMDAGSPFAQPEPSAEDHVPDSWLPPLQLPGQPLPAQPAQAASATAGSTSSGVLLTGLSPVREASSGLRAVSREAAVPVPRRHASAPAPVFSTPHSAASSVLNVSRVTSVADMPGLGEILDGVGVSSGGGSGTGMRMHAGLAAGDARPVLGMKRTVSRARGIADGMESVPTFETPTCWPSMAGGLRLHKQRLRLQVRATQCKAPFGRTYWSDSVELDALGGAAVVAVPAPMLPPTAAIPAARAACVLSVTASQVPGIEGTLALYLLPRYVLVNTLEVPIQYKQQDTGLELSLEAGGVRALRWADASRPQRLCMRVQEAGWLWSGGFELETPGDLFIKVRHRDRGETMLVRVDVATSAAGVLRVTLSHHPSGFAPYRIENCSLETLHARQARVREQQDVLRPYCSLNYAWDEPAQPHKLVLELPGNRALGTFNLDKVGQDVLLPIPRRRGESEQRSVRVLVRAEGPTRVLTVLDIERHILLSELGGPEPAPASGQAAAASLLGANGAAAAAAAAAALAAGGRERLKGWDWALAPRPGGQPPSGSSRLGAPVAGLLWEVSADLCSLGVSLVAATQELSYLRAGQLQVAVAASSARYTLDLEVKQLQVDNPHPWATLPVMLMLPAPISKLASTVTSAVETYRRPAVRARLAVWQRRPAGVLCIEQAELALSPVAVYVEQQHAAQVFQFLARLAADFSSASEGSSSSNACGAASLAPASTAPQSSAVSEAGSASAAGLAHAPSLASLALHPDLGAVLGVGLSGVAPQHGQKIYTDLLSVGTLDLTVSFVPTPFEPEAGHPRLLALQRLLSLADVEEAHVVLAGLALSNALMGSHALAQHLQRHYMRAALPELYKVLGAASVLGDPVRLFYHLGLGVWSFLASPAAGLVESARQRGPAQFFWGLASGTRGLFQNVVFGLSNAASKGSAAAHKAITVLGLEGYDSSWARAASLHRRMRWREDLFGGGSSSLGLGAGEVSSALTLPLPARRRPGSNDSGLLGAVLHGMVGLVSEPVRGLDEGGLRGLALGIKRGTLGFVVLPLASLLEMSARVAEGVRRAVAGSSDVGWVRPPRYVSASEPLVPYNLCEALGRWLLLELERSASQHLPDTPLPSHYGTFVLCVPAEARGRYLVLTSRHVMLLHAREPMWVPAPQWSSAVRDVVLVSRQGAHLRLVALRPQQRHVLRRSAAWDAVPGAAEGSSNRRGRSSSPFSFLEVACESAGAAVALQRTLEELMASTPAWAVLEGHTQILLTDSSS